MVWPFAVAAGIGALGGIAGSLINSRNARSINSDNQRLSWDQWHANNAYNHPKAQMARFREAGLNPNLIYGQMANSPPPAFARSMPSGSFDLGFDKIADAFADSDTRDLSEKIAKHSMAVQDANLELAKARNDREEKYLATREAIDARDFALRQALLPLQAEEIKARSSLYRANATEVGKIKNLGQIAGNLYSDVKGVSKLYGDILSHPNFELWWKRLFH